MKQTTPVPNGNLKVAYLTYLNTCGLLETKLSPSATLEATYDDSKKQERLSFTAIDFVTKQVVRFTPEGSFQHYQLRKVV